ncbi:MAG TPA: SET domain-containing protein-lysine N-methyltransferase [Candidatus Limnocylindria bacterium]|nr:SET domain-containing protein-lysine N-methyltransferase [Candidatus Limnocylindria bacterium]
MTRRPQPGLAVEASPIEGRGCFSTRGFPRARKVAELLGERITSRESMRRMAGRRRIRICEVDSRTSIDADVEGDATAFINHSCEPNLFMRVTRGHVLFFARRDIASGEELTVDYVSTPHPDAKRCLCGSAGCRGTINQAR